MKAIIGTKATMREMLQLCPKVLVMYCGSAPTPVNI